MKDKHYISMSGAIQVPTNIDKEQLRDLFLAWTESQNFGFIGTFDGSGIKVQETDFAIRVDTTPNRDMHFNGLQDIDIRMTEWGMTIKPKNP